MLKRLMALLVAALMSVMMLASLALPALADAPGKFTCTATINGQTFTKKNLTAEQVAELKQLAASNGVTPVCNPQ